MSLSAWIKGLFKVQHPETTNNVTLSKTIGEQQSLPLSEWDNQDIIKELKFVATMQLRTPLRVLKHHGEIFNGSGPPPSYAKEMWEGIWVPVTKSFRELGIPIDDPISEMASSIGPIPSTGGKFLKFILAVRHIVEQNKPINTRRNELLVELKNDEWRDYVQKLGGIDKIIKNFFPFFVELLPGLSAETISLLSQKELILASKISATTDEQLLKINGIGPSKLDKIREFCSKSVSQDDEFIDKVIK